MTVTDENQCAVIDSIYIEPPAEEIFIPIVDNVSCNGENNGKITIVPIVNSASPYQYSLNGSVFSEDGTFTNLSAGIYNLTITDSYGCEYLLEDIQISEPPVNQIYLNSEVVIESGDSIRLDLNSNFEIDSLKWSPDDSISCTNCRNPWLYPRKTTYYSVIATDSSGCISQAGVLLRVMEKGDIFIPNIFSPNNDGINDFWGIYGDDLDKLSDITISIFNRWGEAVYFVQNINNFSSIWDGNTINGQPSIPGVYIWLINYRDKDGKFENLVGDLTLVR